jgi:hypothetical protein
MPRSHPAAVRSVHDRVVRAQRAYAARLREAREALHPLLDEGDAGALELARAIDAELSHITHGSALVE